MREIDLYLMHYGVKGMKWGVRKAVNDDGSLDNAGSTRLYTDDERAKLYKMVKKKKDFETNANTYEPKKYLDEQADVIVDNFNDYSDSFMKDMDALRNNTKFKEGMKKYIKDHISGADLYDDEIEYGVEDYGWEYFYQEYGKHISPETKNAYDKFEKNTNQYFDNIETITKDIVGEHGNEKVSAYVSRYRKETDTYENLVRTTLSNINIIPGRLYYKYSQDLVYNTDVPSDLVEEMKKEFLKK